MFSLLFRLLLLLFACVFATTLAENTCKVLNEPCDRTVFNPCCDNLYCVLKGFADGTCQPCLPSAHFCWSDKECCSGDCRWFRFCR